MSKILNVENGAVYEGYDSLAASEWCTPSFLGCSMCISASAIKGQVTITLGLKTPFGNVTKSFSFNTNTSFTWQPFSKFKITVSITNFNEASGVFSFDLGLNPCVDVPFLGWKCFNYSHTFSVPLLLAGIQSEIDDSQFTSLLTLHASGSLNAACQCDDKASPLLKGDIYTNYLNSQAGFPTIPITQCFPIPTVQCVPTITSCVTGISPICLTQQNANVNAAAIPTLPVNQCIPTVSCIPTLSCIPTASCTGIPFICSGVAQNADNTANTESRTLFCFPTYPPVCRSLSGTDANANAAAIPTLPVNQCIPTVSCIPTLSCIPTASCTGIPFICNGVAQSAGNLNAGPPHSVYCFPTLPQLCKVTGAPADANAAAIPTLPVNQCIPTVSCIPTLSCIPTASCTGIPFICNGVTQSTGNVNAGLPHTLYCHPTIPQICRVSGTPADVNAAAIPTLPVNQCVPTVSCFPTVSCIPTVSCTGIPFICP
ncbi:hypothetical protein [Flavobacterium sp. CLA17]|uniref:hypothetical protein n=1 Tax=Flavobacterium sp. CLA17 TaxID=2724135 RepID=UPI00149326EA|nr:hypothetical protein [Flavobacterium sp. CLA17]QSB25210.1 hypothetical protein HAV12_012570 [Flavobacterium sp. CLA17]